MKFIIKRDGTKEPYNLDKVKNAISKAFESSKEIDNTENVLEYFSKNFSNLDKVEDIQDAVEKSLNYCKNFDTLKEYILYRKQRENIRESKNDLSKTFNEILNSDARDSDLKRENANQDGNAPMGLMLFFGSETEKQYVKRFLISPKFTDLHDSGYFHIHDLNMYACTFNCCNIGLKDLFKKGFSTGHGVIREPQSIQSATALTSIIIQSNQNDMFGGQGVPLFDYELAPYVAKSFGKNLADILNVICGDVDEAKIKEFVDHVYNEYFTVMSKDALNEISSLVEFYVGTTNYSVDYVIKSAIRKTDKDTYQSMQAFIHNLNTMQSRAGAQVPFSSINYGTNTTEEGRMIIKNILKATEDGLGYGETSIFPVQIFKTKNGKNFNATDPNYDLFQYACKVNAKRLYPNFVNIDVKGNIEYYEEGKPQTEMATMGATRGDALVSIKLGNIELRDIRIDHAFSIIREFTRERKDLQSKSLLSEFKDKCGVYKIEHISGKYYIGSSKNIRRRLSEHRYTIKHRGTLGEIYNVNDFNVDNYKFELLEECRLDDLWKTESKYINLEDQNCVNYKDPLNNGNFDTETRKLALDGVKYSKIPLTDRSFTWFKHLKENANIYVLSRNQWTPIRSIVYNSSDCPLQIYTVSYYVNNELKELHVTEDHPLATKRGRVEAKDLVKGDIIFNSRTLEEYYIHSVEVSDEHIETYDFEVDNDMFDLNGIISHNCRTKTLSTLDGKGHVTNRGNIAFTTMNLVRLGIEANKNVDVFWNLLDNLIQDSIDELLERVKFLCTKKVYNMPFLMGQNVYLGSEKLGWNDSIEDSLRNGTLAVGFIGIAECLKALIGKHHAESKEAYDMALEIVKRIRKATDDATKKYGWQFGCFGTPAEGVCDRFPKIDKRKFGIIEGVTDRKFYTNSFHVPVYYNITAHEKMELEAPFHDLCNAGAITYIELDGDLTNNVSVIEKFVKYSQKCGISYFSINTVHDRCPICQYDGIINGDVCPKCGWHEGCDISLEELAKKGINTKRFL